MIVLVACMWRTVLRPSDLGVSVTEIGYHLAKDLSKIIFNVFKISRTFVFMKTLP